MEGAAGRRKQRRPVTPSMLFTDYMKKLLSAILIAIAVITMASCGKAENSDNPKPPVTAEKTIFVFMPYSGNSGSLYYNFLTNIGDMERAIAENGGLGNTHLIVFIAKNGNVGNLINITYNGKRCVRDTVATYTSPTYLTTEGRTALLGQVKVYAPAKTYAMIVGCHGEGWLPSNGKKNVATRFFGGTSPEYQIEIPDFAKSITNAGMKMQFILFDDCYLSTIEVAYDLRTVTDHVIASTSEIMAFGMPYQNIFKYLMQQQPDYKSVCTEFHDFYSKYDMPYGAIGVTDCAYIDQMAALMKNINALHTINDADIDKIQDLDADHFTPTVYYDFGDYVKHLCADDGASLTEFNTLLSQLVPYKACTEKIYSYTGRKAIAVNAFSGMTTSDPSKHERVVETKKQTAWWKATH